MRRARYEILPDDGAYNGEIPGFQGVWANEDTLEACPDELQSVRDHAAGDQQGHVAEPAPAGYRR